MTGGRRTLPPGGGVNLHRWLAGDRAVHFDANN
jgi:hypothetical protein